MVNVNILLKLSKDVSYQSTLIYHFKSLPIPFKKGEPVALSTDAQSKCKLLYNLQYTHKGYMGVLSVNTLQGSVTLTDPALVEELMLILHSPPPKQ